MGAIFLENKAYVRYFQDDTVDIFRFYVKPGVRAKDVRSDIVNGLALRPIRYLLLDEVDPYPASAGTEGDPVSLAERRTDLNAP